MNNNDKILSMLDLIAAEVKCLKETSATKADVQEIKDELRSFKEQTNHRFNQIDDRFAKVDDRLDKIDDRFDKLEADNNTAHEEIIAKIDKQSEFFDTKIDILNKRQLGQEVELSILKKKEAL